jgi:thioredoxin-like negative regulator of GroEL
MRGFRGVANKDRTMSGLAMGLVLQAALLTGGADNYEAALKTAQDNGQPLVVLVGADWCPGCVTMKNSTMPAMARSGALKGVQFVTVNYDQNPNLARQLMRGNAIPQLVVFSKTDKGWHREQITGATSTGAVTGLIQRAVAAAAPVSPKAAETKVVSDSTGLDKSSGN